MGLRLDAALRMSLSRENTRLDETEGRVRETCGVMPPWHFPGVKYAV